MALLFLIDNLNPPKSIEASYKRKVNKQKKIKKALCSSFGILCIPCFTKRRRREGNTKSKYDGLFPT